MNKLILLSTISLFLFACNSEPTLTIHGNWQAQKEYTKLKIYEQHGTTIIQFGANNTTKTKHELIKNKTDYSVKKGEELIKLKFDKTKDVIIFNDKTWTRLNWHNSKNWY